MKSQSTHYSPWVGPGPWLQMTSALVQELVHVSSPTLSGHKH